MATALNSYEWEAYLEDEPVFDSVIKVDGYKREFYTIILQDEAQVFDKAYWDAIMKIWTQPEKQS